MLTLRRIRFNTRRSRRDDKAPAPQTTASSDHLKSALLRQRGTALDGEAGGFDRHARVGLTGTDADPILA